jgi:tetratricopeptide (TPR) repeat protein
MMRERWPILGVLILLGSGLWCAAQTPAEPGVGPVLLETRDGQFQGRLLRQDKDMLWVSKSAADGSAFEAGIPLADIKTVRMPVPRVFAAADIAANEDQFRTVHEALDRLILTLKPFRGLPGIPVDEAILRKGQLYARQGLWREAIRQYEEILKQTYECEQKTAARLRAGIASELAGDPKAALKYFENVTLPEDDDELLSTALFSRANALAAEGRSEDALLDYLRLVVFYPFVQNNEIRGLEAAVTCYAKIKDWESLHKTVTWLQQEYPGTRETKHAAEVQAECRAEMEAAGTVMDEGAEAAPAEAAEAAEETTTSGAPPAGKATTEDIQTD